MSIPVSNILEFLNDYINHLNKNSDQKTEINEIQLLFILISGPTITDDLILTVDAIEDLTSVNTESVLKFYINELDTKYNIQFSDPTYIEPFISQMRFDICYSLLTQVLLNKIF